MHISDYKGDFVQIKFNVSLLWMKVRLGDFDPQLVGFEIWI